jgi:hypothetical protein
VPPALTWLVDTRHQTVGPSVTPQEAVRLGSTWRHVDALPRVTQPNHVSVNGVIFSWVTSNSWKGIDLRKKIDRVYFSNFIKKPKYKKNQICGTAARHGTGKTVARERRLWLRGRHRISWDPHHVRASSSPRRATRFCSLSGHRWAPRGGLCWESMRQPATGWCAGLHMLPESAVADPRVRTVPVGSAICTPRSVAVKELSILRLLPAPTHASKVHWDIWSPASGKSHIQLPCESALC